jgi:replicative DNA helicase
MVWLLYRDDYYDPQSEAKGIAEVDVAKQRNGPTGTIELRWERTCCRFLDEVRT